MVAAATVETVVVVVKAATVVAVETVVSVVAAEMEVMAATDWMTQVLRQNRAAVETAETVVTEDIAITAGNMNVPETAEAVVTAEIRVESAAD